MSDREAAEARLTAAVGRLEQAADRLLETRAAEAATRSELLALRAERERLGRALADTEADAAALRAGTGEVARRLDKVIDRLQALLAE